MIIRNEQLEAMRAQMFKAMCARLRRRLQADPDLRGVDPALIERETPEIVEDAASIGIKGDADVYRLLRFRFRVEPILSSQLIQSIVLRTLRRVDWSVDKRLTFLEQQVLPRVAL